MPSLHLREYLACDASGSACGGAGGKQGPAGWQGATYPNASSEARDPNYSRACGRAGCLFNVSADPTEHVDLAPLLPHVAAAMGARLDALAKDFFENGDVGVDLCPAAALPPNVPCACWYARHRFGGVLGPYQR